jgi:hypothetical protein
MTKSNAPHAISFDKVAPSFVVIDGRKANLRTKGWGRQRLLLVISLLRMADRRVTITTLRAETQVWGWQPTLGDRQPALRIVLGRGLDLLSPNCSSARRGSRAASLGVPARRLPFLVLHALSAPLTGVDDGE